MYIPILFIHLYVDGHLGITPKSIIMQISVLVPDFNSFVFISRSGIDGSSGNLMFNFLKTHYTVFHSGVPFYIPAMLKSFHFSTSMSTLVIGLVPL